jgi:hypothetical protein
MNNLVVAAAVLVSAALPASALAAPTSCEDMLNTVKTALQSTTLSDADNAKVADLENRGIERCKADDDARADDFFAQALALMGK